MKCPLLMLTTFSSEEAFRVFSSECFEVECAWWSVKFGRCSILCIAEELATLWRAQDNLAREINQAVLRK